MQVAFYNMWVDDTHTGKINWFMAELNVLVLEYSSKKECQ